MYQVLPDRGYDGQIVNMGDSTFYWCHWGGSAPSAVIRGQAVQFEPTYYGGKMRWELQTVAAQSVITPYQGIACEALSAAGGVWVQTKGYCLEADGRGAKVTANNSISAGGESLELIANGTTLIYDAAAGGFNSKTLAMALETDTAAEAKTYVDVYLLGEGIVSGS